MNGCVFSNDHGFLKLISHYMLISIIFATYFSLMNSHNGMAINRACSDFHWHNISLRQWKMFSRLLCCPPSHHLVPSATFLRGVRVGLALAPGGGKDLGHSGALFQWWCVVLPLLQGKCWKKPQQKHITVSNTAFQKIVPRTVQCFEDSSLGNLTDLLFL